MSVGPNTTLTLSERIAALEQAVFGGPAVQYAPTSTLVPVPNFGTIETESADGAIGIKAGIAKITKGSAAVLTLAAPITGSVANGGDDGKVLEIIDTTGFAHTVTTPANTINGNGDTVTFDTNVGSSAVLKALGGLWILLPSNGVALTEV